MAALNDAARGGLSGMNLPPETLAGLRIMFWNWFERHAGDGILKRRLLGIVSVTIRVKDLKPLFVSLFGPDPR